VARRTGDELRVAVLGLGEAGGRIASDLVALDVSVCGWDPDPARAVPGIEPARDATDAVRGADVVLSLNASDAAVTAARDCSGGLSPGAVFADLNSAHPRVKAAVADVVGLTGALAADVALMAPVPLRGIGTPALASGPGAAAFAERLGPLGMPVQVVGTEPGDAAVRKLVRSVFMKGLAAAALESLHAARAAGCEEWLREEIASALTTADEALLARLEEGSSRHAARRVLEMEAACDLLQELGVDPHVAGASAAVLEGLGERARAS
jgi:3-hydroxyisobutyrate dehydrogenase-like beta-hydroxyacid dehydrogenase